MAMPCNAMPWAGAGNNPGRSGRMAAQPASGMLHLFALKLSRVYPPLYEVMHLFAARVMTRLAGKLDCLALSTGLPLVR